MIIGIPKEAKDNETRIGLTPKWVGKLVRKGHTVYIQKGLAKPAGINDEEYIAQGALIVPTVEDIYLSSEMVIKLKDYMPSELTLPFQKGQIIICFFHLGEVEQDFPFVNKLIESKVTAVSLELIQTANGSRPVIKPMSEIAGRIAVLVACQYSMLPFGGSGISLAGIRGISKPKIVILGGGTCGLAAAETAEGLQTRVVIFESIYERLEYLGNTLKKSEILVWDEDSCIKELLDCDVLINSIYPLPGMKYPLISRDMVSKMKKGSLIIDLVGCNIIETSKYTTISEPTYIKEGVIHIGIDNMPALVPKTSCELFSQSIFPYVEAIANKGIIKACEDNQELTRAISFVNGHLVHKDIADTHNMPYIKYTPSLHD